MERAVVTMWNDPEKERFYIQLECGHVKTSSHDVETPREIGAREECHECIDVSAAYDED